MINFAASLGREISPELVSNLRPGSTHVYDPYGKSMMLAGGVGCIRLKDKDLRGDRVWFMGASSTQVAHESIPVAVPNSLYADIIERLLAEGALHCTLIGELNHVPHDLDPLYRDLVGVPQLYVLVEQLELSMTRPDTPFMCTGAVLVEGEPIAWMTPQDEMDPANGIYAAFVSFSPGETGTITAAAEWLRDIYVGELLRGRIFTDFDEQVQRFSALPSAWSE